MKNKIVKIGLFLIAIIVINILSLTIYKRFDLTNDHRYTLSNTTKKIVKNVSDILSIQVFLQGDFPAEFKRLQIETRQQLEELKSINNNIQFQFINPKDIGQELINKGLDPSNLQIQENGKLSEIVIFPYAIVHYKNRSENVRLLLDNPANSQNVQLENSMQNLEYAFSNAIYQVITPKTKKIAVIKGNGELQDIYIADFLKKLKNYYLLAPFTLDSVENEPKKTLKELENFDLAIIAKPTKPFSEKQKYTLDQFVMSGKKTLWLIDNVQAELDSLMQTGETLAYPKDLGLTDLFFNYGVRINFDLVKDLTSSQITLATGNIGNQPQFSSFLWPYYPLLNPSENSPITKNIDAVNVKFPNSIDTLENKTQKTILLQTSKFSQQISTPSLIKLISVNEKPIFVDYNKGPIPIAVLLEGNLKSGYNGRVKPFKIENPMETGKPTKMIVISDGDVIANDIYRGKPMELGIDKWTNQQFGNKQFLLNSVNYLLDNNGLLNLKSKTIKINFLNKQKAFEEASKWQWVNMFFPLLILGLFGFIFNFHRRRKYQYIK